MIGRKHRFHGYGSLRRVYQRGKTARTPYVNLRYAARDTHKPYRVAVVVSRKVSKSAVVRNRIRRRIYEAVRRTDETIAPGVDLVFTVFDDRIAAMETPALQKIVEDLLRNTGQNHPNMV
jgi:ribonuclease P protein component